MKLTKEINEILATAIFDKFQKYRNGKEISLTKEEILKTIEDTLDSIDENEDEKTMLITFTKMGRGVPLPYNLDELDESEDKLD